MRQCFVLVALWGATRLAVAAGTGWFLPYEPDEHTIALFHLDGGEDKQRSAGKADVSVSFHKAAAHAEGKFGQGAKLNGSSASLRLTPHEALRLKNDQEFTVELWCRPESNAKAGLISLATRFYLHISPGIKTASFGYRAAAFPIRWFPMSNVAIRRGQWNHVALTHDRDRVARIHVNGRLAATTSHKDEGDYAKGGGAAFGAHDGWQSFFMGSVDEIRISDCVREFTPLLSQRNYLTGEHVRLSLDTHSLPKAVQHAEVIIRAGKKVLLRKRLPRAALDGPVAPASAIPQKNGSIEVTFLTGDGTAVSSVTESVALVGPRVDACAGRLSPLGAVLRSGQEPAPRRKTLALHVAHARELLRDREVEAAEKCVAAAERIAGQLHTGEAAYRQEVRKLVRSAKSKKDIRTSMSWSAQKDLAQGALPWAERIGANELIGSGSRADPEAYALWRARGYHTVMLHSVPIHDHAWLHEHPGQRQTGFWRTDPAAAKGPKLAIRIVPPSWGSSTRIDEHRKPEDHWRIVDMDDKAAKPAWTYDPKSQQVTISNAVSGHKYVVYFRFTNIGVGDPLYPPFQERGLRHLAEVVKPLTGHLHTYWFDDLGFAYPGPTPQGAWDWESYTLAARPETIKLFTQETGIEFDPEWLVMPPKTIEMAPDRRYVEWMQWVRPRVEKWMARATSVLRKHNMRSWLYWGDCHVGIEPFLGSLAAGGVQEIDKPTSDPVTARALVDFPGDQIYRRLRVVWLFDHSVALANCAAKTASAWNRAKRGLLMGFPSAIYWMPFPNVAAVRSPAVREDVSETIAEINDEFTLLGRHLNGHRAFTHEVNLYVVNSWGKVYSWRPWGAGRLAPLTDLPINVRFISLDEIAKRGVPKDAHVLYNYGQPNSAWSGGHFWGSPEVKAAVEAFVRNGGGFIGMQSPSHCDEPAPRWVLADLLGVTAEGTAAFQPDRFDRSMLADTALEAPQEAKPTTRFSKTKAGEQHWVSRGQAAHMLNMAAATRVATTSSSATALYAASAPRGQMSPGLVTHEPGRGRTVYLASWSSGYDFYRLLRRCVFWVAKAEGQFDHLDVTGADELYSYAYPDLGLLALLNAGQEKAAATLRCLPGLFAATADRRMGLRDVVTNRVLWEGRGSALASGVELELVPRCVLLLRVVCE